MFFVASHTVEALPTTALLNLFQTCGVDRAVLARTSAECIWRDLQLLTTELFQSVFHFLCRFACTRREKGAVFRLVCL